MPRRTPVREIQSEEVPGSPLRRSSRISNASPVPTSAPTKILSRRNSATESTTSTPTRVTRSRRSSFSLEPEKAEEVDKKVTKTPRTRRASLSQNDDNQTEEETTTKRKTRGSSAPKEQVTEVKKPATRRRKSVSEDDEKSDENETVKRSTRSRSGSLTKKTDLEDLKRKSNSESSEKLTSPIKKTPESAKTLESIEEDNKEGDSPQTKLPVVRMKRLEVAKVDLDLSVIKESSFTEEDSTPQEDTNSISQLKEETEDVENISKEKEPEPASEKVPESAKTLESIEEVNKEPQAKIPIIKMKRIEVEKVDLDQQKEETEDVENISKEKEPQLPSGKVPESPKTLKSIEEVNKEPQAKIPIIKMKRIEVEKVDLDQHKEETEDVDNISKEKEPELASKKDEKTENADSKNESPKLENTKSNEENLGIVEKSSVIKENPSAVQKDAEIFDESLSETFQLHLSPSVNETSFTNEIKENSPSNKENVSPQKKAAFVETECEPMEVDVSLSSISPSPVKSHRKSLSKSLKTDDVGKELEIAAKVTDEIANFLSEEIKLTGKNPSITSKLHESTEDVNSTGGNRKHFRLSLKKNKESISPKVNGISEDKCIKAVTEKNEESSKEMLQVSEKLLLEKIDAELESAKDPEKEDNDTASILDVKPSEERASCENYSQKESPKKIVSQESQVIAKDNEDLVNEESETSSAVEYASPIEELGDSDEEPLQVIETEETEKEVENSSSTILPNESQEKHESPQIENKGISQEIQTSSPTKTLKSTVEEDPEEKIDSIKEQVSEGKETKEEQMEGINKIDELGVTKEPKSSQEETAMEATIRKSEEALSETSSPTKSLNESNAAASPKDKHITEEPVKETEEVQKLSPTKSQEKIEIEETISQPEETTAEDSEVEELISNSDKEDIEAISAVEANDVEDDVSTQENESTVDDDEEEEEGTSVLYSTSESEAVVEGNQTDEKKTVDKKITDTKKTQIEKDKSTPEIVILSEDEEDDNRESKNEEIKGKTPEKEDKVIASNQRRSSFTMQENLKAGEGKNLREQIHKVVDMFCAGIKNKDVKLNVSLEYTGQFSDDSEQEGSKSDVFEVSLAAIAAEDQEDKAPKNEKGSKRRKICHEEKQQQLLNEDSPSKDTTENEESAQMSLSESKKKKKKRKAVSIELQDASSPTIADISPSKKQKKLPNTPYKTPNDKEKAPTSGEESEEDVNTNEKNHQQVVPNSPCHYDFDNLPSYMQTADESQELDVTWAPSEDEDTESSDSSTKELNETTELREDLVKLNEDLDEQGSGVENKIKKQKSKSSASVKLSFSGEDTSDDVFHEENEDEESKQKGKKRRKLFHLSDYDISKAMKMDLEDTSTETMEEQKSIKKKKKKNKTSKQSALAEENDLPQTSEHVKNTGKDAKKKKKKNRKVQNITSSTSEDEDVADAQEFGPDVLFSKKVPANDVEVDTDYFKPSLKPRKKINKKSKLSKVKPSVTAGTSEWDVEIIS